MYLPDSEKKKNKNKIVLLILAHARRQKEYYDNNGFHIFPEMYQVSFEIWKDFLSFCVTFFSRAVHASHTTLLLPVINSSAVN